MGEIKGRGDSAFRDYATDGVPASGPNEPSKSEIRGLFSVIDVAVAAAQAGLTTVADTGTRDAYFATEANRNKLVYVNNNNGSATDPANGVYEYVGGARLAQSFYQGVAAVVQPLVNQAQSARDQAVASAAAMIPMATATVASNDASVTLYNVSVPSGINAGTNGQKFSFVVPATSLGGIIRLNVTNVGTRDVFFTVGRRLREGWIATFSANNPGSRWNFETQVPADLAVTALESSVQRDSPSLALALGVMVAEPINGNPDDIFVPFTGWANDATFEALIVKTNTTANPIITVPNHRVELRDAAAGSLVAGQIARFIVSFGVNGIFLRGTRTLPPLESFGRSATDLFEATNDTVYAPYGNVSQGSDGRPVFAPRTIRIVGRGSSVSTDPNSDRNGASPPGKAPVQFFADLYNAQFGPNLVADPDNLSHGGHVASHGDGQWAEALAQSPAIPAMLLDCFGMNDLSPYSYNSGQTADYLRNPIYYEAELRRRSADGVKLIALCTTPHPHTGRYPYNLNGVDMTWPYAKASPVNPDQMVPPAAQSVVARDWTGGGVVRDGDVRAGHVNMMIRNIARRLHLDPSVTARVALLDVEWAWFRYGVEVQSIDALYNAGEIVHPNALGHQVSYQRCIRELVNAMRRGRGNQWTFRGEVGS